MNSIRKILVVKIYIFLFVFVLVGSYSIMNFKEQESHRLPMMAPADLEALLGDK